MNKIWSALRPTPKQDLPVELYQFALLAPSDEGEPGLWPKVEERIDALPPSKSQTDGSLWSGMLGGLVAASLTVILVGQFASSAPSFTIKARMDFDGEKYQLANAQKNPRRLLNFQIGQATVPSGRSFQVWYVPNDGAAPLSLGIAPDAAAMQIYDLPSSALADGMIAVSEEAIGGSLSSGPEGPIVVTAPIALFF